MQKAFVTILFYFLITVNSVIAQTKTTSGIEDRHLWLSYVDKIARPVLSSLADDKLREKMPVVLSVRVDNKEARTQASYLEAFARTMSGIAPWLNLEGGSKEEITLRNQYRDWAVKALTHAVDPVSKDYLKWEGGQPLVDASFLALALVRCPWLWEHVSNTTKEQVVAAFKLTRQTVPGHNNWILFSGMIETFFCKYGIEYNPVIIEYGIEEFGKHWYVGDGMFSDGMQFHFDYYNSYVIQPYLANIIAVAKAKGKPYTWFAPNLDRINKRYAVIQERLINTDGTFPVTGRSIAYRGGAFHHLADMALRKQLPDALSPAQVRCALTAVINKTFESASAFTKEGWLAIGLYGNQPNLADAYINTGSLYLCSNIFLALGLSETDEFWTSAPAPWTAVKVWGGQDLPADHALDLP